MNVKGVKVCAHQSMSNHLCTSWQWAVNFVSLEKKAQRKNLIEWRLAKFLKIEFGRWYTKYQLTERKLTEGQWSETRYAFLRHLVGSM